MPDLELSARLHDAAHEQPFVPAMDGVLERARALRRRRRGLASGAAMAGTAMAVVLGVSLVGGDHRDPEQIAGAIATDVTSVCVDRCSPPLLQASLRPRVTVDGELVTAPVVLSAGVPVQVELELAPQAGLLESVQVSESDQARVGRTGFPVVGLPLVDRTGIGADTVRESFSWTPSASGTRPLLGLITLSGTAPADSHVVIELVTADVRD